MDLKTANERKDFIDIAKGIGIYLVVWGHCKSNFLFEIHTFHMPLFFFISGYLHSQKTNFEEFFISKWKRIIIPFFTFLVYGNILLFFTYLCKKRWIDPTIEFDFNPYYNVFYGLEGISGNTPIWFLLCIFQIAILYFLLNRFVNRHFVHIPIAILVVGGYFLFSKNHNLPFFIDSVMSCILFYHIGYIIKSIKVDSQFIFWNRLMFFIYAIICGILYYIFLEQVWNYFIDLRINKLRMHFFKYVFSAFTGIGFIWFISKSIHQFKPLSYLGKNSLLILGIHSPIVAFFRSIVFNMYSIQLTALNSFLLSLLCLVLSILIGEMVKKIIPTLVGENKKPKKKEN